MSLVAGPTKRPGTERARVASWQQHHALMANSVPKLVVSVDTSETVSGAIGGSNATETIVVTPSPANDGNLVAATSSGAPAAAQLKVVEPPDVQFGFAKSSKRPPTMKTTYGSVIGDDEMRRLLMEATGDAPPLTVMNAVMAPPKTNDGPVTTVVKATEDAATALVEATAAVVTAPVKAVSAALESPPAPAPYRESLVISDAGRRRDSMASAFSPNGALARYAHTANDLKGRIIRPNTGEALRRALDAGGHMIYGNPITIKMAPHRFMGSGLSSQTQEFSMGYTARTLLASIKREAAHYGAKMYPGFAADVARYALVTDVKLSVQCMAGPYDGKWYDPPALAVKALKGGFYHDQASYNDAGHMEIIRVPLAANSAMHSLNLSPYEHYASELAKTLDKRPHLHSVVEILARDDVAASTARDTVEAGVVETSVTYRIPRSEANTSPAAAALIRVLSDGSNFAKASAKNGVPFAFTVREVESQAADKAVFEVSHRAPVEQDVSPAKFRSYLALNVLNYWDRLHSVGQGVLDYSSDSFMDTMPYPVRLVVSPPTSHNGPYTSHFCVYASVEVTLRFPVGVYSPA